MNFLKTLGTAALVGTFCAASAFSFECTGDSQCIFEIDGNTPPACIAAIEVFTGPLTGSGPVKLAFVDYKSLVGTCFTLKTNQEGINKITQTQEPTGFRFEYSSQLVEAEVPGYSGTFYSNSGDLVLESVNTYPNELGENGGVPITYVVQNDVSMSNGPNTLVLRAGSSVTMTTKSPTVYCTLNGECYINFNGVPSQRATEIEIESEQPADQGGGIRVGIVTAKRLLGDDFELTLNPDRAPDESFFRLESLDPDQDYPANVRGFFASQIEYDGEIYRTEGVLEVESEGPVDEWPPAPGAAQYRVTAPTIFISDSGLEIVIEEGHIFN